MRRILAAALTITACMGILMAGSPDGAMVNLTGGALFAVSVITGAMVYGDR